jgi:hypothetical protein
MTKANKSLIEQMRIDVKILQFDEGEEDPVMTDEELQYDETELEQKEREIEIEIEIEDLEDWRREHIRRKHFVESDRMTDEERAQNAMIGFRSKQSSYISSRKPQTD